MCGIAGYISLHSSFTKQQLLQATAAMQHRGPDAEGFYFAANDAVGLAHRRLSILDLSAAANQPMYSADGRYCMVFNGEVYNFASLKNQLADKGASLKTTSDTEVILELYAQQGTAAFAGLNGMFALAIYDAVNETLTLCRDHVGIKPLFYYADDRCLVFASELKVISKMMGNTLAVNRAAIPNFLHLGFIPQPQTIYQNVYKFPAAHWVQVPLKSSNYAACAAKAQPFWQLANHIKPTVNNDEQAAARQLQNLLYDAVQKQLVSDVPLGTFLSGGTDSSLVTAIAAKLAGSNKIKTFSIAIDDGKYNEAGFARQVADYLKTDHHEFAVKEKEVMELADKLLPAYDEPFADSSAFPVMMVSRLARQHVTVALSGDGGDELFHGYNMYTWAQRLQQPWVPLLRKPLYAASKLMSSKWQRAGHLFHYPAKSRMATHIFSQEQYYFKEQELQQLLINPDFNFEGINQAPMVGRVLQPAEIQSLWDFDHYLKDDLLVKVDRASMQYGLESRVPLLDYRLAEFACNLSPALKIKNATSKYLLKQVLYQHVPAQIFNRPKWGFTIPLGKWLKTDLKYLVDTYTAPAIIDKYGLLHTAVVQQLVKDYFTGKDYLYNRVWLITLLHWWLEENSSV
ncbi:MAG: hypothetical protein RL172_853 [Bacteroidota bacterium]|jgi:asparagine synthase (glutamine-hydrolysing)